MTNTLKQANVGKKYMLSNVKSGSCDTMIPFCILITMVQLWRIYVREWCKDATFIHHNTIWQTTGVVAFGWRLCVDGSDSTILLHLTLVVDSNQECSNPLSDANDCKYGCYSRCSLLPTKRVYSRHKYIVSLTEYGNAHKMYTWLAMWLIHRD